ncbi:hypothetical protein C0J52_27513 [Blattella germanica]|nr:hypothetical protein C0J52_27513 [Blattella germanica]
MLREKILLRLASIPFSFLISDHRRHQVTLHLLFVGVAWFIGGAGALIATWRILPVTDYHDLRDIGSGISEDEAYCGALSDIADNGKIDISVVKFMLNPKDIILNQKDILIDELRERIHILTDQVALLKQCAVPTSNVPFVTTPVLEDTLCESTRSAVKEDLIPKQKCVKPGKLSERCTVSTGTDSKQTVNTREGIVSEQVVVDNSRKLTISEDNSSVNKGFKSQPTVMAGPSSSRGLTSEQIIQFLDEPTDENVQICDSGSELESDDDIGDNIASDNESVSSDSDTEANDAENADFSLECAKFVTVEANKNEKTRHPNTCIKIK